MNKPGIREQLPESRAREGRHQPDALPGRRFQALLYICPSLHTLVAM